MLCKSYMLLRLNRCKEFYSKLILVLQVNCNWLHHCFCRVGGQQRKICGSKQTTAKKIKSNQINIICICKVVLLFNDTALICLC